ncbi:hypothetical protein ACHAXS_010800 [Conticribra weissflogii]
MDSETKWDPSGIKFYNNHMLTHSVTLRKASSLTLSLMPVANTHSLIHLNLAKCANTVGINEDMNKTQSVYTPAHVNHFFTLALTNQRQLFWLQLNRVSVLWFIPSIHRTYFAGQRYIDWMPAWTKSITQAQGSWVITNGKFTEIYPKSTHSQESAKEVLVKFCKDVGVPEHLIAKSYMINLTYSEPECSNQIYHVNVDIHELKRRWYHKMVAKQAPK